MCGPKFCSYKVTQDSLENFDWEKFKEEAAEKLEKGEDK
jgi:phosphomethylpyrimidine synthase